MEKKKYSGQVLVEFENEEEYKRLKRRDYHLRNKYNISLTTYEEIKEFQENKCAICHQETTKLVVDHDHNSGALRGLLCHSCNVMLGHARDNVEILSSAIEYLNKRKTTYCKPSPYKISKISSPNLLSVNLFYKDKTKTVMYESSKRLMQSCPC
ncbi:MAG: endonuclease VII domain-containing protein [Candidatus Dojkabacteria bacterium]|nr:endonuclease VII domain-containing protein [Candidatus Dojkabacteria bacterium]